jgi:hypothetical protein
MERKDKVNYYLDIADAVLPRSTCLRRRYGAIIVSNDEIISTGYNGAPRGRKNCLDTQCCTRETLNIPSGQRYELCRSVHAEANSIISAARSNMIGGTLYLAGRDAKTGCIESSLKIHSRTLVTVNSVSEVRQITRCIPAFMIRRLHIEQGVVSLSIAPVLALSSGCSSVTGFPLTTASAVPGLMTAVVLPYVSAAVPSAPFHVTEPPRNWTKDLTGTYQTPSAVTFGSQARVGSWTYWP